MKKEKGMSIHIYGMTKNETAKLHSMARKKGYSSLNAYLQFLVRREIENDLIGVAKYDYKNYFESMQKTLLSLSDGYVQAAKRKVELEKSTKQIFELIDNWLFIVEPELQGFGENNRLTVSEKSGLVFEKHVQGLIKQEEKKRSCIDESYKKIVTKHTNEKLTNEKNAEIKIRGLTKDDITSLKLIANQTQAANLNQFMLNQVYLILRNGGLNIYDNRLADDIIKVKDMLFKISDAQTKQELHDMEIIAKLDTSIQGIITWIEFMNLMETKQF